MSEDIDALRRLVGLHERIADPTNECTLLVRYLARAVDELEKERDEARAERDLILCQDHTSAGRRFDIKCVICRWDAAEQDAARLAEALEDIRLYGLDASDEPVWMRDRAARALAAHEARVGGGR